MRREVDLSRQTTLLLSALRARAVPRPLWIRWHELPRDERTLWTIIAAGSAVVLAALWL